MSITAITTGKQNSKAVINWLNHTIAILRETTSVCVSELIIQNEAGELGEFSIHVPYVVKDCNNATTSLVDNRNKAFYTEDFDILPPNESHPKHWAVNVEGYHALIRDVEITVFPIPTGSILQIRFIKELIEGESAAIRILYECDNVIFDVATKEYHCSFFFYDRDRAYRLRLETAIRVRNFYCWVVFPYGAKNIRNITPSFFQQRTYSVMYKDNVRVFYGPRTDELWEKLPRTVGIWLFEHKESIGYALEPWTSLHCYAEYNLISDSSLDQNTNQNSRHEYATKWTLGSPEGEPINEEEYDDLLKATANYKIFIIDKGEYKSGFAGEVYFSSKMLSPNPDPSLEEMWQKLKKQSLEPLEYRLLFHTLKNNSIAGDIYKIMKDCWFASEEHVIYVRKKKEMEKRVIEVKKPTFADLTGSQRKTITGLNNILDFRFGVKLRSKRQGIYRLTSTPEYCVIEVKR